MKSPLKLLVSLLALGLAVSAPMLRAADEKAPPPEGRRGQGGARGQMMNPEQRIAAIDQAVGGLTDDQKAKIKDIYAKTQEQSQALRGGGGDREANRAKMQEIMTATREQVRAVLTADQQKKFDAMPQPARGGQGGGQRGKKKDQ